MDLLAQISGIALGCLVGGVLWFAVKPWIYAVWMLGPVSDHYGSWNRKGETVEQ